MSKWWWLKDRQRKGKAKEKGTKEKSSDLSGNLRGNKYVFPFWLALICIRQACGEETELTQIGISDGLRRLLWGWLALMPQGCTILCLPNKTLSHNWVWHWSAVSSFYCGETEPRKLHTLPTILRDCSNEAVGEGQYMNSVRSSMKSSVRSQYIKVQWGWRRNSMPSSTRFRKVTRSWCHHEGIQCFSRYEEMQGLWSWNQFLKISI